MEGFRTYRKYLIEVIRVFFIILLIYAAATKLLEYGDFKLQLSQFPYVSSYAGYIAWAVPTIEILIAGLFFFPRLQLKGLYASFFLMTVFTFYITAVLSFSDSIPCTCGGIIASLSWTEHLVFNAACAFLAYMGIRSWQTREGNQRRNLNKKNINFFVATKAGEAENLNQSR